MDFQTFADAYSHNRRSKEHLINLILTRVDKTPEFSLLLGAGASVSSGVKPASEMINDWQKKLYAANRGKDHFQDWLLKQEWHNTDEEYSRLFETVYDQPSQRRAYIERATKKAKPNWGYAYLTSLLEKNLFNVIFTTNFDDLMNESCYRFTNDLRPMVCAHDSAVSSVRLMSDRPKVIKLHGDFLYDSIKNTSSELQSLEANMRNKFIEFAKEYGLIVIGYAGNDQSVMDLLDVLVRSEAYFRNGIYWCIRPSCSPSKRLRQLLRNDRIFWVEIEGFDEFMSEIASSFGAKLPDGVTAPHKTSIDRTSHLFSESKEFNSPILESARNDLSEIYKRLKEALSSIGLFDDGQDTDDDGKIIEHLKDKALPLLLCQSLVGQNKHDDAVPILQKIIKDDQSYIAKKAWQLLIECLLRDKSSLSEVDKILNMALPEKWNDSNHFMLRSYFALYINKPEDSLTFSARALELNPGIIPAKVNKALALLMLDRNVEFEEIITELKQDHQAEHHKAAAYLLTAELNECIRLLQKSFALGRYSAKDAGKDVVFRAIWGMPQFEQHLKPFTNKGVIEFPYLDSCPMTDAESKLKENILLAITK